MKIRPIYECPSCWDEVADWMFAEFCATDRPSVTRAMMLDKIKGRGHAFPYTFVAWEGAECVGTVTLYENDLAGDRATPWLGSLVVAPARRGRGLGRALIAYVLGFAKALGYETVFLRTEHTGAYYERLGWRFVRDTVDPAYALQTKVYQRSV